MFLTLFGALGGLCAVTVAFLWGISLFIVLALIQGGPSVAAFLCLFIGGFICSVCFVIIYSSLLSV